MPVIFGATDLPLAEHDGAKSFTLANSAMIGTDALQVERVVLEANARSLAYEAANTERFVYVIKGRGQAQVREQTIPLAAESVLWLEQQDAFYLKAEADGLEVLLCRAPARE